MNLISGRLGGLLLGTQATAAKIEPDHLVAFDHPRGMNVSYPAVIGAPLGVAYIVAELTCLFTNITFHLSCVLL